MPLVLAVPTKSPYVTAAQWAAALRANKGMTFASAGVGTPGHLAGELLKLKLDSNLVHVPYKGAGPALNDVAAGQVDFYFPAYPSALPLAQGGKIRLLAVSTAKRSTVSPEMPTVAEATGIANFDFPLWVGFFGPHGMPMDITQKLNTTVNKITLEPAINARLNAIGPESAGLVNRSIHRLRARPGRRKRPLPPLYSPLSLPVDAALRQLRARIHRAGSRPELVDCLSEHHAAVE